MNAKGLTFMMTNVAGSLEWSFFDALVNEGVSAAELSGTRQLANSILKTLQSTPPEQIEELVAKFDPRLTEAIERFQGEWQSNPLAGFRDAQVVLGHVNTIFNEAGIKVV